MNRQTELKVEIIHCPQVDETTGLPSTSNTSVCRVFEPSTLVNMKTPFFCISGFGCSDYNYEWIAPILANAGHKVVLFNPRGFGGSTKANAEYTLTDISNDSINAMKHLDLPKCHLIGISMGGFIAQLIALKFSFAFESLHLLCTTSGGSEFPKLPELSHEVLRITYSIPEPKRSQLSTANLIYPETIDSDPELFKRISALRATNQPEFDQIFFQKKAVDLFLGSPIPIENIKLPTLVLSGKNDRFVTPIHSQIINSKIMNSELKLIEQSDHLFFLRKIDGSRK